MGDSHTLVFHDFLAERAGLVDQLANELGFAPDLIGTRGSGATPVRITLYRRSLKEPGYLAKKKVVVWCFAAREFTEAAEGWARVPVAKVIFKEWRFETAVVFGRRLLNRRSLGKTHP